MHELSLGQAIIDTVRRRGDGRAVRHVTVRIGYLRQVVPDALQFAWEMLTDDSELAGCRLEIEHVPAIVVCRACGETTTLAWPILLCAACEGSDVELVSGEEFLIATMDVVGRGDAAPEGTRPDLTRPDRTTEVS